VKPSRSSGFFRSVRWARLCAGLASLAGFAPACGLGQTAATPARAPAASESKPEAPIVAGELVLRFAPGSAIGERAAAAKEASSDDALRSAVERSFAPTGLPIAPHRWTSGGELLLVIEREPLRRKLAALLVATPEVAEVELETEPRRVRPSPTLAVRVLGLDPAAEPAAVEAAVAKLAEATGWPLALRRDEDALRVTLDLRRLTWATLERLARWPEVESAQPNFALQGY
jgi:hypothetical protein